MGGTKIIVIGMGMGIEMERIGIEQTRIEREWVIVAGTGPTPAAYTGRCPASREPGAGDKLY